MIKENADFTNRINFRACSRLDDLEYAQIYFKISTDEKLQVKVLNPIGAASFPEAFRSRPRKQRRSRRSRRSLRRSIGSRLRRRANQVAFDPNAIDGDDDGRVQDSTEWERPATPAQRLAGRARAKLRQRKLRRESRERRRNQVGFYVEEQGPGFSRRTRPVKPEPKTPDSRSKNRARERVLRQASEASGRKPRRRVQRPEEIPPGSRVEETRQSVAERESGKPPPARRIPQVDREIRALNGVEGLGIMNRMLGATDSIVDGEYLDERIAQLVTSETQRRSDIYSRALKDNPDINLAEFDESLGDYGEALNRLIERFTEWQESHRQAGRDFRKFIRKNKPPEQEVFDADVVNPGLRQLEEQRQDLDNAVQRFDRIVKEGQELAESQEIDDLRLIDSLTEDYFGDEFLRQDEQEPPDSNMDGYVTELSEIDRRSLYEAKRRLDALRGMLEDLSDDEKVSQQYLNGLSGAMNGVDKLIDRVYSRHLDLQEARERAYQAAQDLIWDEDRDEIEKQLELLGLYQDSPRAVRPTVLRAIDELGKFLNPDDPNSLHRSMVRSMLTADDIYAQDEFRDFITTEQDFNEESLEDWIGQNVWPVPSLFDEYGLPDTDLVPDRYGELNELFRKNQSDLTETLKAIYRAEIDREMPSENQLERFVRGVIEAEREDLISNDDIEDALRRILDDEVADETDFDEDIIDGEYLGEEIGDADPNELEPNLPNLLRLDELTDDQLDEIVKQVLNEKESRSPQSENNREIETVPEEQVEGQKGKYKETNTPLVGPEALDAIMGGRMADIRQDVEDMLQESIGRILDDGIPYFREDHKGIAEQADTLLRQISWRKDAIDDLLGQPNFDPESVQRALNSRLELKELIRSIRRGVDDLDTYAEDNWENFRRSWIQDVARGAERAINEDPEILDSWPESRQRLSEEIIRGYGTNLSSVEAAEIVDEFLNEIDKRVQLKDSYKQSIENLIQDMQMSEDDLSVRREKIGQLDFALSRALRDALEISRERVRNELLTQDILDDQISIRGMEDFGNIVSQIGTREADRLSEGTREEVTDLFESYRSKFTNDLIDFENRAKGIAREMSALYVPFNLIETLETEIDNKLLAGTKATDELDRLEAMLFEAELMLGEFFELLDNNERIDNTRKVFGQSEFPNFRSEANRIQGMLERISRRTEDNKRINRSIIRPRLVESLDENELEELDTKIESIIDGAKERRRRNVEPIISRLLGQSNPWEEFGDTVQLSNDLDDYEVASDLANAIFEISVNLNGYEFRTEVEDVDWNGSELEVRGSIFTEGYLVGDFSRTLTPGDGSVYNASMHIDPEEYEAPFSDEDLRSSGFATVFNTHAMTWYKGLGFNKVSVTAERDGIFVWPYTGFTDLGRGTRSVVNMRRALREELEGYDRGTANIIDSPEAAHIAERMLEKLDAGFEQIRNVSYTFDPTETNLNPLPPTEMEVLLALSANTDKDDLFNWWQREVGWGSGTVYLKNFTDPRVKSQNQVQEINEEIDAQLAGDLELVDEDQILEWRSALSDMRNMSAASPDEGVIERAQAAFSMVEHESQVIRNLSDSYRERIEDLNVAAYEVDGFQNLQARSREIGGIYDALQYAIEDLYFLPQRRNEELEEKARQLVEDRKQARTVRLAEALEKKYGNEVPWVMASGFGGLFRRKAEGEQLTEAQQAQLLDSANTMFAIEHAGLSSEVTHIRRLGLNSDESALSIDGVIKDEEGSTVGRFSRDINLTTGTINHHVLRLDEEHQNKGFASVFNGHAELWYKALGGKTVYVNAIDDGPFIWPLSGFNGGITSSINNIDNIITSSGFVNPENRQLLENIEKRLRDDFESFGERVPESPSDAQIILAMMIGNNHDDIAEWWKKNSNWYGGNKDLSGIDQDPVGTLRRSRRETATDSTGTELATTAPDLDEPEDLVDKAVQLVEDTKLRRSQRAAELLRQMYPEEAAWENVDYVRDAIIKLTEAEYASDEYYDALEDIEKFATDALTVEFTTPDGNSFSTRVISFSQGQGPEVFDVRGVIFAFDETMNMDRPVGYFDRTLEFDTGRVVNENFAIAEGIHPEIDTDQFDLDYSYPFANGVKGSGFGSAFNSHAFSFWRNSGAFSEVDIPTTGWTDGKYVWGKLGFEADQRSQEKLGSQMWRTLDRYYAGQSSLLENDQQAEMMAAMLDYETDRDDPQYPLDYQMVILALLATGLSESNLKNWIEAYAPVHSAKLDLDTFEPPF